MKKQVVLFIFAIFCIYSNLYSQVPSWQWAKGTDGYCDEKHSDVKVDNFGNVYIIGEYYSQSIAFDLDTLINNFDSLGTRSNAYLVKYDKFGNLIWVRTIFGRLTERAVGLALDTKGNVFVSGVFYSDTIHLPGVVSNLFLTNHGFSDVFIAKYDSKGEILWANSFGGTSYDDNYDCGLEVDKDGNVFSYGAFRSDMIVERSFVLVNTSIGRSDNFIVKYNTFGSIIWARSFGGNLQDDAKALAIDSSGNVFVAGTFKSDSLIFGGSTLYNLNVLNYENYFLLKYDPLGNPLWAKSAGNTIPGDDIQSICTDRAGNVVLVGRLSSHSITFGGMPITCQCGGFCFFMIKFNTNGNAIWHRFAYGIGESRGISIVSDNSNNIYVTGIFNQTINLGGMPLVGDTTNNIYNKNIFIAKYNSNGNGVWAKKAMGSGLDYPMSIALDQNNYPVISGFTDSPIIYFDSVTLTNSYFTENAFVAKLAGPTVGYDELFESSNFSIAPNPFTDRTEISFKDNLKNATIKLFDLVGNEVLTSQFSGENFILKRGQLSSGIYLIQVVDENKKVMNKKIVIQ